MMRAVENGYKMQFAKGYIVYMMASSYFKKAICKNKREETHLYLHYCEMPQQKQFKHEEEVIRKIENIDKRILQRFETLQCHVIFQKVGKVYTIRFLTASEELIAEIDEKGNVDFRVYSKSNQHAVECIITIKKENGKKVICFQEGLEQLLVNIKEHKAVNIICKQAA